MVSFKVTFRQQSTVLKSWKSKIEEKLVATYPVNFSSGSVGGQSLCNENLASARMNEEELGSILISTDVVSDLALWSLLK